MKILLIGSGGREHALAHTFHRQGHVVYCLPGNGGTDLLCEKIPEPFCHLSLDDHAGLADFVKTCGIHLTVVGPEAPLAQGIADSFLASGLPLFGPTRQGAQLESSKAFAKQFMAKHAIPTARFIVCPNSLRAREAARELFSLGGVVVKPSGLTGGKGVTCCTTLDEADAAIASIMEEKAYGNAGDDVVIEELLDGEEVSVFCFCDGKQMIPMLPAQDHKRLFDGDLGPNTGGVGAYSPAPFVTSEMFSRIRCAVIDPTDKALKAEGIDYRGVLYFGLMLTEEGPKVLEYNCRFGDPETQAVLPLLDSDLATLMLACCTGKLHKESVRWKDLAACCVVMVADGYPGEYRRGHEISGLDVLNTRENTICFHAGTKRDACGRVFTNGGRVLGITGLGNTLPEAIQEAYRGVKAVNFESACYRTDIGCR